ncbi:MAG: NAD-dependent epimerase/dehydratase family protein [Prolixibacteraceae bacterium]|nr:NAD-dependent epimerase/dehydratase family protein [Prolixibacteraceae bacterium]
MIFVTGGTGLTGAHLLYELTVAGKRVKALKRNTGNLQQVLKTFSYYSENPESLFKQIEWVDGDILDYFTLEKLLKGVTEIYHCAAIVSFQKNKRREMISNNVKGTENVVNAAIKNGVRKICHVSSVAVLGRFQNGTPVTEKTNWLPSKKISGYSESKFFSETEIWRGIEEGLDAVIVNPSIILGPANWETGSARLFKTIYDGLNFYTKGTTGFVDVKDVTRAMILLMDEANFERCKNQRFLLNAENLSYQNIFNQIADALEKPRPKYFSSDFLLGLGWRTATFIGWLRRKPSMITRDTVANSNKINNFDGNKITRTLNFKYHPISDSIIRTARFLKQEPEAVN